MNAVEWDENNVHTCAKCGDLMGRTLVDDELICHCGSTEEVTFEKFRQELVGDERNELMAEIRELEQQLNDKELLLDSYRRLHNE